MERTLEIPIPKTSLHVNAKIRGSLRGPVIVLVHGLSCHMDETLYFNAARWFESHGFASVRFNLYDWKPGTRKLKDCTIRTHARDLDLVVRWLRGKGAGPVHVVGHSYGGPTILASRDRGFASATLWDPTALPTFVKYGVRKRRGYYLLPGGWEIVIGEKMFKENGTLDSPKALGAFPVPSRVLCADTSPLHPIWKNWFASARAPHSFGVIRGSGHLFDEDGVAEKLYAETLKWIRSKS